MPVVAPPCLDFEGAAAVLDLLGILALLLVVLVVLVVDFFGAASSSSASTSGKSSSSVSDVAGADKRVTDEVDVLREEAVSVQKVAAVAGGRLGRWTDWFSLAWRID